MPHDVEVTQPARSIPAPRCSLLSCSDMTGSVGKAARRIGEQSKKKEAVDLSLKKSSLLELRQFPNPAQSRAPRAHRCNQRSGAGGRCEYFEPIPPNALRRFHIAFTHEPSSNLEYFYQQGALRTLTFKSLSCTSNKPAVFSAKCGPINTLSSRT